MIGAFVSVHTFPIVDLAESEITVRENLCPLRDEISSPLLVLERIKEWTDQLENAYLNF